MEWTPCPRASYVTVWVMGSSGRHGAAASRRRIGGAGAAGGRGNVAAGGKVCTAAHGERRRRDRYGRVACREIGHAKPGRGAGGDDVERTDCTCRVGDEAGGRAGGPPRREPGDGRRETAGSRCQGRRTRRCCVDPRRRRGPRGPPDRFEQYAEKRWGKGWKLAAGGRKRALDEVSAFADDASGFQEKVKAELEVFS